MTVRATDTRGGSDTIAVTITINANDAPAFPSATASMSVFEGTPAGTSIGSPVMATDADGDALTYTLEGTDADSFDIDASTGQIRTRAALDADARATYSVTVRATDGKGGSDTIAVTITVISNVAPEFPGATASRSVFESAPAGGVVGDPVTATDADGDTLTYTLEGTDAASFDIDASTGQIRTKTALDADTKATYSVTVRATDGKGGSATIEVTITVIANVAPAFPDATASRIVFEGTEAGGFVGDPVTATDADGDTLTYTLEGADAALFQIDGSTGQIRTRVALMAIHVGATYTVTVVASDWTSQASIEVTISVVRANAAPAFSAETATRSVAEAQSPSANVGDPVTAADPDEGDTLAYSLGGADADSFTIDAETGQIRTAAVLDEEIRTVYSVTVNVTDNKDESSSADATIDDTIEVTIIVTDATFGCATNGAVADATNTGLVSDCEALREARDKLENGGARLNWSEYTPMDQWQGVYFGGTPRRVTKVALSRMGLGGVVPAELGDLSMLVEINLHTNRLSGSIPAELNRLSRLEKLRLHNNRLSGDIPNLSGLTNLEMLWLSGKEMALTGPVPSWLNSMSAMESVSMWGNELSGPIPDLTGMTSLRVLKLQSNKLTGGVPSWFGQMHSLRNLYLHLNPLGGTIPSQLGNMNRLGQLWLHSSGLTGSIPPELQYMVSLRGLNLRDNDLTGPIPPQLGNMTNMLKLRLHNNRLSGTIPPQLGT